MTQEEKQTAPTASEAASTKTEGGEKAIIDFEALLAPIPGDNPSGELLQYEGTYDRIRDARREDDPSLPRGIWERELKKANWKQAADICGKALTRRTKDLQIAVWFFEALMHLHGFRGIAEGFKLISDLCDRYWDTVYPAIEENNDIERRIFPIFWLNEKLSLGLKLIRITRPQSGDHDPYGFADWERANMIETQLHKDKSAFSKTEMTRSKFLGSVSFTPLGFYQKLHDDIIAAQTEKNRLQKILDEKCGKEAPSLRIFGEQLQSIEQLVKNFLMEKKNMASPEDDPVRASSEQSENDASGADKEGKKPFLSIRNRAEAYRMLSEAADYLHIHEPHSPTPYLVKRAVTWGNMPLEDLLKELVGDQGNLKQILQLLGIEHQMKE